MCDVCKSEGKDWEKMNGRHKRLRTAKLYSTYEGRVAKLNFVRFTISSFLCPEKLVFFSLT